MNFCGSLRTKKRLNRGEIELDIRPAEDHVTVTVLQTKYLLMRCNVQSALFIKVSLQPDDKLSNSCMVEVPQSRNDSTFNKSCTLGLRSSDDKKRLIISIVSMDNHKRNPEIIGCMSFGLKHLKSKSKKTSGIKGWYYLLSEHLGSRKHIRVPEHSSENNSNQTIEHPYDHLPCRPASGLVSRVPSTCSDYSSVSGSGRSSENPGHVVVPRVNSNVNGMQPQTLVIYKTESGYGFTVKNACPVRVGRVKPHGPSERAGLLKGDFIIRINGQNVSRSSAESIAEIVRRSTKCLVMDICRPQTTLPSGGHSSSNSDCRSSRAPSSELIKNKKNRDNEPNVYDIICDKGSLPDHHSNQENIPPPNCKIDSKSKLDYSRHSKRTTREKRDLSDSCDSYVIVKRHQVEGDEDKTPVLELTNKDISTPLVCSKTWIDQGDGESEVGHKSWNSWNPDLSDIIATETCTENLVLSYCSLNSRISEHQNTNLNNSNISLNHSESCDETLHEIDSCELQRFNYAQHYFSDQSLEKTGIQAPNCSLVETDVDGVEDTFHEDSRDAHWSAISNLVACERRFVSIMQLGIQQFSRPLRHCVLSRQQHLTLFQNIEKLVTLSEYHLNQLTDAGYHGNNMTSSGQRSPHDTESVDAVGDIYRARIKFLCSAYTSYLEGLTEAIELLQGLHKHPEFIKFMQQSETSDLHMAEFIIQPQYHIQALLAAISGVLDQTPVYHHDHLALTSVVQALRTEWLQLHSSSPQYQRRSPGSSTSTHSAPSSRSSDSMYHKHTQLNVETRPQYV